MDRDRSVGRVIRLTVMMLGIEDVRRRYPEEESRMLRDTAYSINKVLIGVIAHDLKSVSGMLERLHDSREDL